MTISVVPSGESCGAEVTGVDLAAPLSTDEVAQIRAAWLEHHVLSFRDQVLDDDQLERVALYFGEYGDDGFFGPIEGREHIAAIRREADETQPIFGEIWHSDWSYQPEPPAATFLYGIDIPPVGGDTLFVNNHLALERMPSDLRSQLEDKVAIHSAALGYAPDGTYGDEKRRGSMDIRPSDTAYARQTHPLIRPHPESGKLGIFGTSYRYIVGFVGFTDEESKPLLDQLLAWQDREEFVFTHRWENHNLLMWDNRSVLHRASGGYEGYRRELHRITIN
ncbi:MAG: TauD/TfdA dioxygenase family protein [Thalassospira sp.]|uniref:TauD/TfdA dioxygenase family protein n=1 Tax=Thalassospira sp. TaxID=1912094 RepID=UPI003A884B45